MFIPGFVSHHDTYFSLKQNRLFVTIVSPLLGFTANHNRFKGEKIKTSFLHRKKKIYKRLPVPFISDDHIVSAWQRLCQLLRNLSAFPTDDYALVLEYCMWSLK